MIPVRAPPSQTLNRHPDKSFAAPLFLGMKWIKLNLLRIKHFRLSESKTLGCPMPNLSQPDRELQLPFSSPIPLTGGVNPGSIIGGSDDRILGYPQ